jgi:hypothetical protein
LVEAHVRNRKSGIWIAAVSAVIAGVVILTGEGFLLNDNLHPGARLLRSESALKAMFQVGK